MMISEDQTKLLADVLATFPGIHARPLGDYAQRYAETPGLWVGGEALMPDGLPIFCSFLAGEHYDGGVHCGFEHWLEMRGWFVEQMDSLAFAVFPIDSVPAGDIHIQPAALAHRQGPWAGSAHAS